jgi:hypothetical protein
MLNLKKWFKTNQLYFYGALLGTIGGFFYWKEVGCLSGTCAITSNPYNSMIYVAVMGALFLSFFKKETKATPQNED